MRKADVVRQRSTRSALDISADATTGILSTLNRQRVLLSQLSRLHLDWYDKIIYIKPLPDCLLHRQSYSDKDLDCSGSRVGFLHSY